VTNQTTEADARGIRKLTKMQKKVKETDVKDGTCILRSPYAGTCGPAFVAKISPVLPYPAAARLVAFKNSLRSKEAQVG